MIRALLLILAAAAMRAADSLAPGTLPTSWITGGPDCTTVPDWQVHAYNDDFYILRESGCINYEKPFLYLIFGEQKVLLEDTGAGKVHTAAFVQDLVSKWATKKGRKPPVLLVIHSHSHGDHVAGDQELKDLPGVELIPPTVAGYSGGRRDFKMAGGLLAGSTSAAGSSTSSRFPGMTPRASQSMIAAPGCC